MIKSKCSQFDRLEKLVIRANRPATRMLALHILKKNYYDPYVVLLQFIRDYQLRNL